MDTQTRIGGTLDVIAASRENSIDQNEDGQLELMEQERRRNELFHCCYPALFCPHEKMIRYKNLDLNQPLSPGFRATHRLTPKLLETG